MPDWGEVFRPSTPILEIVVRGSAMFLSLYVLMRVVGKREGGAHALTDLLVVVLIAEAAAHGMTGEATSVGDSVLLVCTVLFWSVLVDALAYRFPRLRRILKSAPTPLIVDGVINRRALRRELMEPDELMEELRLHGITDVGEVARAYLESNGMVSVIPKDGRRAEGQRPSPAVG